MALNVISVEVNLVNAQDEIDGFPDAMPGRWRVRTYAMDNVWKKEAAAFVAWSSKLKTAGFAVSEDAPKAPGSLAWEGFSREDLAELERLRRSSPTFKSIFDAKLAAGADLERPARQEWAVAPTPLSADALHRAMQDSVARYLARFSP